MSFRPMVPGRRQWELLRCCNPACEHEGSPRPVGERLLTLPCQLCRSEMHVLPLAVIGEARPADAFNLPNMRSALQYAVQRAQETAAARGNPEIAARLEGLVDGYTDALQMLAATGVVAEGVAQ
jgi:hypothetical protein